MLRSIVSNGSSILIALLFAVIVWIVATNEENPLREGLFPDAVPITFENRAEGLTLLDPSRLAARVRIRTESSTWNNLDGSTFRLAADLGGLTAGDHQVSLKATSSNPRVRIISVDPPSVTVHLEEIRQVEMPVHVRVLDEPPLGYEMKTPTVTPITVTVTGPQPDVETVNDATVDVSLRGEKTAVDREVGVVLHDAQGNPPRNVTVEPAVVQVHIPIEQRVGYKDAAVKALITGNVAPGYWISNINVDPSTVTLVGAPESLNKLGGFVETEPLDVSGAKENIIKRVRVKLPEGVSVLNATDVMLGVSVEPVLSGLTVRRPVNVSESCNLPATVSPDTVEVILAGPLPILQALKHDDVQIIVDPPRCEAGAYQVELRAVNVPERITVESIVPATAQVNVTNGKP